MVLLEREKNMYPEISDLHTNLKELLDALDKHDVEAATQQALDLQKSINNYLGEWVSREPENRVIRAIADLKMKEIKGNAHLVQQVFSTLVPRFEGRYPEHKLLTNWCQEARDPKDISWVSPPQISSNGNGD